MSSSCLPVMFCCCCCFFGPLMLLAMASEAEEDCSGGGGHKKVWRIGGVIDQSSRLGKEQKIAMEMAVYDSRRRSFTASCSELQLDLYLRNFNGNSSRAASMAIDLIDRQKVEAVVGVMTMQQAALISDIGGTVEKGIPVISITPIPISSPLSPPQPQLPSFIQMSHNITTHTQCIAAVVGQFRWRKVTAIYERSNSFEADYGLVTRLSDSLQAAGAVVENHSAFPLVASLSDPKALVEKELNILKAKSCRVFIVLKSSIEFAVILFEKANQMGLMEKDSAWIVSDDISSLLDSADPSSISNMQGVIGFKTSFLDSTGPFKDFKRRFRRIYRSEYPEEEEYSNPSIFALRAYEAVSATAKAIQKVGEETNSSKSFTILDYVSSINFEGLSGNISFNNGQFSDSPTFRIINVYGKSYKDIVNWSPGSGFSAINNRGSVPHQLRSIYWPGGERKLPKGWTLSANEATPLRIGVPAMGAFNYFVNVTYDAKNNKTDVGGFSIQVFEAAVNLLPYQLPRVFVPYYGDSYDDMVAQISNKSLDAVVGDTEILAERFKFAEFSQPYMETGVVMVVTVRPDVTKERFMFTRAFKMSMWILVAVMSFATGFVVWLNEYVDDNPEFRGPFPDQIGSMFWFSVTVMSFAQRESIRSNLSRFALATWLFVIVVVNACFTAVLTSMLTVPMLRPSVVDIDYLRSTNAPVGCNEKSFIVQYLVDVLHFRPENIRKIESIRDYPGAFESGRIEAAFLLAPHARIFLAQYCQGYMISGPNYKLGGFGFAFPTGSPLVTDISKAILQVKESGDIDRLEKDMLFFSSCSTSSSSSTEGSGGAASTQDPSLGPQPFSGLFIISGGISATVFLITIARLLEKRRPRVIDGVCRWASLLLDQIYNSRFGSQFFSRNLVQRKNDQMTQMNVQMPPV